MESSPVEHKVYLENVWKKISPGQEKEIIGFWESNNLLRPEVSAAERVNQVVFTVRNIIDNSIVGLSTAMEVTFRQLNNKNFYLYRSVILPDFRIPGLNSKLIVGTRDFLETYSQQIADNACIGMLTFVENPRVQQFRREAVWRASKMVFIGTDKEGRHIRVYYFKGAMI